MLSNREFVLVGLIAFIMVATAIYLAYPSLSERPYTIQDVEVYCCKNPNVSITPQGDNCTKLQEIGYLDYCRGR